MEVNRLLKVTCYLALLEIFPSASLKKNIFSKDLNPFVRHSMEY